MRSGTSLFDWTLFKKNVTRFWPIWATYLTVWMFVLPVSLMMEVRYNRVAYIGSSASAHLWFALFFGCFSAMAVLSHLYSPKSANFFGALPIRREGIFLTQYVSGLAFIIVPDVIVAAAAALAAGGGDAFGAAFKWLAVGCGMYFFFYTLAVLCGMFAGHILALPAFYTVMNCLVYGVTGLVSVLMNHFYRQYYGMSSVAEDTVRWLTPVYKLSYYSWSGEDLAPSSSYRYSGGGPVLAIYVLCAVLMAAGALWLYRSRRTESAGDVVAVRAMRPVFKYGVAVCSGLTLGYVSTAFLGDECLPVCVVVWTVLGYFAAQMILDKTFRVFKKWKGAAAVGLAVTAALLVMAFDLTGFDSWVPDPAKVEYVEVDGLHRKGDVDDSVNWVTTVLTKPEDVQKIVALHKLALEDREQRGLIHLVIQYHTKTGTRSRNLYLSVDPETVNVPGTAAYILESIYTDRELYWHLYGFDELEELLESGGKIDYMGYANYDRSDGAEMYPELALEYFQMDTHLEIVNQGNIMKIWEAIKADFAEGNIGVRHVGDTAPGSGRNLTISWPHKHQGNSVGTVNYDSDSQIAVPLTARHTIEALLEIIPKEIEAQGYDEPSENE